MKCGDISELFSKELSQLQKSRKQWKLLSDKEIDQRLANIRDTFKQKPPLFRCQRYRKTIIWLAELSATVLLAVGLIVLYFPDAHFSRKLISGVDAAHAWWFLNHAYVWQRQIRHFMLPIQPLLIQIIGKFSLSSMLLKNVFLFRIQCSFLVCCGFCSIFWCVTR